MMSLVLNEELELLSLGRNLLSEVAGPNKDGCYELINCKNFSKDILIELAKDALENNATTVFEFLLCQGGYKEEMSIECSDAIYKLVGKYIEHPESPYAWSRELEKYILKDFLSPKTKLVQASKYLYKFVKEWDVYSCLHEDVFDDINLDKKSDMRLLAHILNKTQGTLSALDLPENIYNSLENADPTMDKSQYSICSLLDEFLTNKGYKFHESDRMYYIPIPDEDKDKILQELLNTNKIKYYKGIPFFMVFTKDGEKELYVDSVSRYTVSDNSCAHHFITPSEFINYLVSELEVKKETVEINSKLNLYLELDASKLAVINDSEVKNIQDGNTLNIGDITHELLEELFENNPEILKKHGIKNALFNIHESITQEVDC